MCIYKGTPSYSAPPSFRLHCFVFQCCHPRTSSAHSQLHSLSCKLRSGRQCSPSAGPCCDHQCNFVPATSKQLCKAKQDCTSVSYCDGSAAQCPQAENMPDNVTECNEGTQVCQQGDCKGSICLKFGLEQCFLSSLSSERRYSTRDLCDLACQVLLHTKTIYCGHCQKLFTIQKNSIKSCLSLDPGPERNLPVHQVLGGERYVRRARPGGGAQPQAWGAL